ncbi:MAG: hypothetical protein AAF577_04885 [Pseudomonadota bacterium]
MAGILVSIAIACFVAVQATNAGAPSRITIPAAAIAAAVMAALWAMAIETLFPSPDYWSRVMSQVGISFVAAGIGGAAFTWAAGNLMTKITAFKEKYPER